MTNYTFILKEMIDCRTVYTEDHQNQAEFDRFYQVLHTHFPLLNKQAQHLVFGSGCFFYHLQGSHPKKTILYMSHHDVVKETEGWDTPAFEATIKDGALYGRGTIDTKTTLFAEMQATEELLEEGFDFSDIDFYIGSSNNEEVSGDGMVKAVAYFKEQGIHFDVILDEGGAIMQKMIPGYDGKSAMVAVHEKSRHLYSCKTKAHSTGHKGLSPDDDSTLRRLSQFIDEVEHTTIFKDTFYPEVKETFQAHVPYMTFPMNFVFKHLSCFSPIVKNIMKKIPPAKAMLSTSILFTTFHAGDEKLPQIKAKEATATMFIRCIREEDLHQGLTKIQAIAKKYGVTIDIIERDYCRPTSFNTPQFDYLKQVIQTTFPDVVVAPFLLTAGTDARRFSDLCDHIFRFAPIDLNPTQFNAIHGDNEHIYLDNIETCVQFYKNYLKGVSYESSKE